MLHHPTPAVAEYGGAPEHRGLPFWVAYLPLCIALSISGRITRLDGSVYWLSSISGDSFAIGHRKESKGKLVDTTIACARSREAVPALRRFGDIRRPGPRGGAEEADGFRWRASERRGA